MAVAMPVCLGCVCAQSLIVGGMEGRSSKEADAITLGMLVTLQDVLLQLGRDSTPEHLQPLHVVGMASPHPCLKADVDMNLRRQVLGVLVTLQDVLLQLGRDSTPEHLQSLHVVGMVS